MHSVHTFVHNVHVHTWRSNLMYTFWFRYWNTLIRKIAQQTRKGVMCTHWCTMCTMYTLQGQRLWAIFWPRYRNIHTNIGLATRKSVMCTTWCTVCTMCTLHGQNSWKHSSIWYCIISILIRTQQTMKSVMCAYWCSVHYVHTWRTKLAQLFLRGYCNIYIQKRFRNQRNAWCAHTGKHLKVKI